MFDNAYDYKYVQQFYAEKISEAQECHARQRRLVQQFAQTVTRLGNLLVRWSKRLQNRQVLEIQGNEGM